MGAPKQKWTPEEEGALRAGVDKYGAGKWRAIQKDPKFGPILSARSNVDLKDKWRNLSACQGGHSRSSKVMGITPGGTGMRKMDLGLGPMEVDPLSVFQDAGTYPMRDLPTTSNENSPQGARYDDYIVDALASMRHPNGSSFSAIATYIEEHHNVPQNFRKVLPAKMKTMIMQAKVIKVDQNYKLCSGASKLRPQRPDSDEEKRDKKLLKSKRPRMDVEVARTIIRNSEEVSFAAARAIAEAEEASIEAELAARDWDRAEADLEAREVAVEVALYHARQLRKRAHSGSYCSPLSTSIQS